MVLALVALVCLPCAVAVILTADAIISSVTRRAARLRRRRIERDLARRAGLGWSIRNVHSIGDIVRARQGDRDRPVGPPIEQVAADLRRLSDQRINLAARSPVWFTAVSAAYDERLWMACRELEITEYLRDLDGSDLEIERVRVEGKLTAAGLTLRDDGPARQDQR
jgi:hypothetical protein